MVVVLALLFAFAYGFAKLVERYGGVGDRPPPCESSNPACSDANAPPAKGGKVPIEEVTPKPKNR
ncbi:hypothetical protein CK219_05230 [Mesorhizobium sp. WSM4313]|nr:hypothetical protein CK219_05230 [Mesorhizobium sp. WSM4313]